MFDAIVCFLLACGIATGLWTMHVHRNYFADFTIRDLFRLRMDGVFYVLNQGSTTLCVVDIVLRIGWLVDVGWTIETGGAKWHGLWLTMHVGFSLFAIMFHVATNLLLRRTNVCAFCRQPLKELWASGK